VGGHGGDMFAGVSGQGVQSEFWGYFWKMVFCCCYPCILYKGWSDNKAGQVYWAKEAEKKRLAEQAASADAAANAAAPSGAYGAV